MSCQFEMEVSRFVAGLLARKTNPPYINSRTRTRAKTRPEFHFALALLEYVSERYRQVEGQPIDDRFDFTGPAYETLKSIVASDVAFIFDGVVFEPTNPIFTLNHFLTEVTAKTAVCREYLRLLLGRLYDGYPADMQSGNDYSTFHFEQDSKQPFDMNEWRELAGASNVSLERCRRVNAELVAMGCPAHPLPVD